MPEVRVRGQGRRQTATRGRDIGRAGTVWRGAYMDRGRAREAGGKPCEKHNSAMLDCRVWP